MNKLNLSNVTRMPRPGGELGSYDGTSIQPVSARTLKESHSLNQGECSLLMLL